MRTDGNAARRLNDEAPDFVRLGNSASLAVSRLTRTIIREGGVRAVALIANQISNDFTDLIDELVRGRGRPATRTARALVEHLVNLASVLDSADMRERYEAHAMIVGQLEASARIGLDLLSGEDLAREEGRLSALRKETSSGADNALTKYGPRFKASWSPKNLFDRASSFALLPYYNYYRLASAVLHGSASGTLGTVSASCRNPVHRHGPALLTCPYAYHEGVAATREAVRLLAALGLGDPVAAEATLDSVLAYWPNYRRAISVVDSWLWPDTAPLGPQAVLAVARNGKRRWYLLEPEANLMVEGTLTTPIPEKQQQAIAKAINDGLADLDLRLRWLTIIVAGVHVEPIPEKSWVPSQGILVPKSYNPPRVEQVGEHPP